MHGTLYRQTHNTYDLQRGMQVKIHYGIETTEGYFEVMVRNVDEGIFTIASEVC